MEASEKAELKVAAANQFVWRERYYAINAEFVEFKLASEEALALSRREAELQREFIAAHPTDTMGWIRMEEHEAIMKAERVRVFRSMSKYYRAALRGEES